GRSVAEERCQWSDFNRLSLWVAVRDGLLAGGRRKKSLGEVSWLSGVARLKPRSPPRSAGSDSALAETLRGAENTKEISMKFTWMMMLLLAAPLVACGNSKPAEVPEGGEPTEAIEEAG